MKNLLLGVVWTFNILGGTYLIAYTAKLGWNHAENRTKKVCDLCFRDIKRWNDAVNLGTREIKD